ncbi:MAG: PIG-L family deacetylase [Acidobacteriia bacterium]|nr:PIG-L family deacetylase [Terriglobia bacterium]
MNKRTLRMPLQALVAAIIFVSAAACGYGQESVSVVTDRPTYDAGSEVGVEVLFSGADASKLGSLDLSATVRYAGEDSAVAGPVIISRGFMPSAEKPSTGYQPLWKIPADARTGRYEVDIAARESGLSQSKFGTSNGVSFAVYRKLVKIDRIQLDRTFYTSGDTISCRATIKNLTDHAIDGLRVEFSDRYWPWIAGPAAQAKMSIVTMANGLSLAPGEEQTLRLPRAGVAPEVKQPAIRQYGVVVWDRDRKNVYDIAFSPLTFVQPPGVNEPKPYYLQYAYPTLSAVNTSSYREFYPPGYDSTAIRFDHSHTMFQPGNVAPIRFAVSDPTDQPWKQIMLRMRALDPNGKEVSYQVRGQNLDIPAHGTPLQEETRLILPPGTSGIYRVNVEVNDAAGAILAASSLELGVNPLPKSLLIFCAHEDDEGAHYGIIRAAVENHIPVHLVYFTSGDAGSCDRYYEQSCDPAQALNFGALRMDETRAALGHLGVPPEDIYYLGLPDGGSGQIWYDHVEPSHPYLSVLLASDHAPYTGLVRPNLPYSRDSVIAAVKEIIKKLQPAVIYTAHPPSEGHIDHVVNGYFVVKALQELEHEGALSARPEVRVDRIYNPREHPPTPYHYAEKKFFASGDALTLAQEADWFYQSQGGNRAQGNLRTFNQLAREETYRVILDWQEHEGWNEK